MSLRGNRLFFMLELEVYAPGLRELGKIMELDRTLSALGNGTRYKVDRNQDIAYLEFDDEPPVLNSAEVLQAFHRLGLPARFVGAVPSGLQASSAAMLSRTQHIRPCDYRPGIASKR